MHKIVVLDGYCANPGDISWEKISSLGSFEVFDRTENNDDVIIDRIGDADIVFTNKTPLSQKVFDACNIKFVGVLATGYNIVDTVAAANSGAVVCNVPAYSTAATAQFAIALLLEVCHHIGHHDALVHKGEWQKRGDFCFWDAPLTELDNKTLGIIGLGSIGRKVAQIAQALGMNVIAASKTSRVLPETDTFRYAAIEEIIKTADVISLHCPLTDQTKEIINASSIAKMKDGVIIINNGRGPLVNEQDVADALECGKIKAFAADVLSTEPPKDSNPLLSAKNCILTPHISWAPKEARERLMSISYENLKAFLDGNVQNKVN